MSDSVITQAIIQLTASAADQLKKLLTEQPANAGLRISVKDGGCSGMSNSMAFVEAQEGDHVFETSGVKVFIDPDSAKYITGTVLDFEGGLTGKGFSLKNPNVKGTCGCGQSFTV